MIFLYLLLFFFVILFEFRRRREYFVDFLSIFNFFFSLYYLFVPITFLISTSGDWKYLSIYEDSVGSMYLFISIFIALVLVNVSYVIFNRKFCCIGRVALSDSAYLKFIILGLALGCAVIYIKSIGYGGIVKFVMSGYLNRAGDVDGGFYDYVTPFVSLIVPFVYIYWAIYLKEPSFKKLIPLFLSMLFYISLALSTGGRGNLILTIIPLFFIYLNVNGLNKKVWLVGIVAVIVALTIVIYGKSIFYALSLSQGSAENFYSLFEENQGKYAHQNRNFLVSIFRNFDHAFVSAYLILENVDRYGGYRYIFDYPRVVLDALPGYSVARGSLDVINYSIPAQINKELIGLSGGYVPVGWVGLMLLNGSFGFLASMALISGIFGALLSSFISSFNVLGKEGLYIFLAFFWFWFFFHSDPLNLIIPMFSYYVFIFIFAILARVRIKNQRVHC
jgi:oligosaccharide repeat unit polymerase